MTIKSEDDLMARLLPLLQTPSMASAPRLTPCYSEKQAALKTRVIFQGGRGQRNGWEALEFRFNERFVVHSVGNPDRLEAHLPTK